MSRLAPFLLASAVLHAGLLAGSAHRLHVAAGDRIEVISVYLDADRRPQGARIARRATEPLAGLAGSSATAAVAPAGEQQPVADATTPSATAANDDVAATAMAAARVRALVRADLARHFYYPAIARARGWEGEVLLAFRVQHDGYLQATRVARTSGFVALDRAALHSLRRVERIAQASDWRLGRDLDMQIPVIYRLTDTY